MSDNPEENSSVAETSAEVSPTATDCPKVTCTGGKSDSAGTQPDPGASGPPFTFPSTEEVNSSRAAIREMINCLLPVSAESTLDYVSAYGAVEYLEANLYPNLTLSPVEFYASLETLLQHLTPTAQLLINENMHSLSLEPDVVYLIRKIADFLDKLIIALIDHPDTTLAIPFSQGTLNDLLRVHLLMLMFTRRHSLKWVTRHFLDRLWSLNGQLHFHLCGTEALVLATLVSMNDVLETVFVYREFAFGTRYFEINHRMLEEHFTRLMDEQTPWWSLAWVQTKRCTRLDAICLQIERYFELYQKYYLASQREFLLWVKMQQYFASLVLAKGPAILRMLPKNGHLLEQAKRVLAEKA